MALKPNFLRRAQQRIQLFGYRLRKSGKFKVGVLGMVFSELTSFGIEIQKPKKQVFFRRTNQLTETQFLCDVISLVSFLLTIAAIRKSLKIDKS